MIVDALLSGGDARTVAANWQADAPLVSRLHLAAIAREPSRNGAIYRRHGLFPYAVSLDESGLRLLEQEREGDLFASTAGLSPGEFLGRLIGRWVDELLPGRWPGWQRDLQLLTYKIERAKRAGDVKRTTELARFRRALEERSALEREVRARRLFGLTLH